MNAKDREALRNMRAQARLVARLSERMKEQAIDGLRTVRIDGAPGGSAAAAGLERGMIQREELSRIARREGTILRRMEKRARQAMEGMKPEQYAFCALYYIGGMALGDVAEAIERSERQCLRYKREIDMEEE